MVYLRWIFVGCLYVHNSLSIHTFSISVETSTIQKYLIIGCWLRSYMWETMQSTSRTIRMILCASHVRIQIFRWYFHIFLSSFFFHSVCRINNDCKERSKKESSCRRRTTLCDSLKCLKFVFMGKRIQMKKKRRTNKK